MALMQHLSLHYTSSSPLHELYSRSGRIGKTILSLISCYATNASRNRHEIQCFYCYYIFGDKENPICLSCPVSQGFTTKAGTCDRT